MGSMFFASSAVASDPDPGIEVATVTVASGETLWHHAKSVAAPGEDLRDIVDVIKDLNTLPNSELQAGQQLLLPAARNSLDLGLCRGRILAPRNVLPRRSGAARDVLQLRN